MNLPNRLTCVRVALALVFLLFIFSKGLFFKSFALAVFIAAMITDYWDGKIAREQGEITHFGQLMDPIADKLLTLSAFIAFMQMNLVPAWMVMVIVIRDLVVTGMRLARPRGSQAARASGKWKTVFQFALIIGVLVFLVWRETPYWQPDGESETLRVIRAGMLFIVVMTLWSGISAIVKSRPAS